MGARKGVRERRRRICGYCGQESVEEYTDDEWQAQGFQCEECALAELVDGTVEDG
ncbi:MAG: hypothetical protein LUQ64_01070 [Methanomicrobiales archaeon]|nr:hypothetical protein [Methanomicrobiales archaeon]